MTTRRPYETPTVVTLTADQILDIIGPAQATASGGNGNNPYDGVAGPSRNTSVTSFR